VCELHGPMPILNKSKNPAIIVRSSDPFGD